MMKTVLILAYDFFPYISVGSLRPYSWYLNFMDNGIYPVIITRQWLIKNDKVIEYVSPGYSEKNEFIVKNNGTIIYTPYIPNLSNRLLLQYGKKRFVIVRKLLSILHEVLQYFFPIGNKKNIYRAAREYIQSNKVDLIIATVEPYVLLRYASKLSAEFNIPWIADYRDPWSMKNYPKKIFAQSLLETYLENKYNKSCLKIITVSEIISKQIRCKDLSKFIISPNGYDENVVNSIDNNIHGKKFTIALMGTIYRHHPILSFLKVLDKFVLKYNIDYELLHLYGNNIEQELKIWINENCPNLLPKLKFYLKMQNSDLLKKVSGHSVFLLFNAYSTMGTKIYEYIALKRKIIFCFSEDKESRELYNKYFPYVFNTDVKINLQEELINTTNSGIIVRDSYHLEEVFDELYNEFINNGYIKCESKNIAQYSRKKQAEVLAHTLNNLIIEN